MQRPSFLEYKKHRHLKFASLLIGISILAYLMFGGMKYGGTWFGYLLGIISALMVFFLFWYGIRKRRTPRMLERRKASRRRLSDRAKPGGLDRRSRRRRNASAEQSWRYGGTLQGWLSVHVYLGVSLLVLVSLHSGFHFGWNVHTLTYVLVVLVATSGIYGSFAYTRYPPLIAQNIGEGGLNELLGKIAELDELARVRALGLPDEINALVAAQREETRLGGNLLQQLNCRERTCDAEFALQRVHALAREHVEGDQPRMMRDLYAVLLQKQRMVEKARSVISLSARMQVWLYLHAPLSIALLAALLAHVLTILIYW
jgi:hypothetical protein